MKRKVTFYRPHVHCNNKQPFPRISATWLEAYCYPLKRYLCADKLLWSSIQTPHNFQLKTSAPTCCSITSIWNSISHQFRPKGKLSSFVRKQQTSTWNHTSYFLPQPNRSVRSGTLPEQSVVNQSESFYRSQFPLESWSPEPAGSKRGKTLSLSVSNRIKLRGVRFSRSVLRCRISDSAAKPRKGTCGSCGIVSIPWLVFANAFCLPPIMAAIFCIRRMNAHQADGSGGFKCARKSNLPFRLMNLPRAERLTESRQSVYAVGNWLKQIFLHCAGFYKSGC